VNLTNPMMLKGPFRELIPVEATVSIKVPSTTKVKSVKLLFQQRDAQYSTQNGMISLVVPRINDHEIIAIDFA
ncbi:MAG TPA: hypothetical protein VF141_20215, partial [Chryseolinea sp.]